MKITHLNNGDMVVAQGARPMWVIVGIAAFLFFAKDAFIWVFTTESEYGNRWLAIAVIVFVVLFFYRVFSLNSQFLFSHTEKQLSYCVQHPFSTQKGVVAISVIEKAVLETDDDGASRIIIQCSQVIFRYHPP